MSRQGYVSRNAGPIDGDEGGGSDDVLNPENSPIFFYYFSSTDDACTLRLERRVNAIGRESSIRSLYRQIRDVFVEVETNASADAMVECDNILRVWKTGSGKGVQRVV